MEHLHHFLELDLMLHTVVQILARQRLVGKNENSHAGIEPKELSITKGFNFFYL
jgi:hypothetical protein